MASSPTPSTRNRLLSMLPKEELARLLPRFERVEPRLRQVVLTPEEPVPAVLFPEGGWVSMLVVMGDGRMAEVGLVGSEGMVGLPLLLQDGAVSGVEAMVQATGTMLRMPAPEFRAALDEFPSLRPLLLRYALAFQQQVSQTAACNGHHSLEQRLARWLLMAHDRSRGDSFQMTQEFLALMLCVHRPGVTVAARLFQRAGLITYGQGKITVLDREGLEATACECHAAVKRHFSRLLGEERG